MTSEIPAPAPAALLPVSFAIVTQPSRSKGYARYQVAQGERKVIESTTGNRWVSSDKAGDAETGTHLVLTTQVSLIEGQRNKQTLYTQTYTLVVEAGATAEIYHRPGSQGLRLVVTGARLA